MVIYENANYQGAGYELSEGRYDVGGMGLANDALSSLRVPSGMKVTLYEHSGFTGLVAKLLPRTPVMSAMTSTTLPPRSPLRGLAASAVPLVAIVYKLESLREIDKNCVVSARSDELKTLKAYPIAAKKQHQ